MILDLQNANSAVPFSGLSLPLPLPPKPLVQKSHELSTASLGSGGASDDRRDGGDIVLSLAHSLLQLLNFFLDGGAKFCQCRWRGRRHQLSKHATAVEWTEWSLLTINVELSAVDVDCQLLPKETTW